MQESATAKEEGTSRCYSNTEHFKIFFQNRFIKHSSTMIFERMRKAQISCLTLLAQGFVAPCSWTVGGADILASSRDISVFLFSCAFFFICKRVLI